MIWYDLLLTVAIRNTQLEETEKGSFDQEYPKPCMYKKINMTINESDKYGDKWKHVNGRKTQLRAHILKIEHKNE